MKKITATAVAVLILLQGVCFMSACKQDDSPETFDYASLYRTSREEPYAEEARLTSRARYGYTLSQEQGYNGWYYLYGNDG